MLVAPSPPQGPVTKLPGFPLGAKPKGTPQGSVGTAKAQRQGDLISYYVDIPGTGMIVVKTSEAPDVVWGSPDLNPTKVPAYLAMVQHWGTLVDDAGVEFRVPSNEIFAIMYSESGGNQKALSPVGAHGLMQVMPYNFPKGTTDAQMYDPRTNIRAGVRYLANARQAGRYDLIQVASMYNAGPPTGPPWTNEAWLREGQKILDPVKRAKHDANVSRWGYASQPGYIDSVVAAFNTGVKTAKVS
jgi:hypothetical protein